MTHMTPAEVAAHDQRAALVRDEQRNAAAQLRRQRRRCSLGTTAARWGLGLYAMAGLYAGAACAGLVPAAAWSTVG